MLVASQMNAAISTFSLYTNAKETLLVSSYSLGHLCLFKGMQISPKA